MFAFILIYNIFFYHFILISTQILGKISFINLVIVSFSFSFGQGDWFLMLL